MNDLPQVGLRRLAPAALAGWLIYAAVDFTGHGVVLASYWKSTAEYWRTPAELFHLIPLGYLSIAIYCGALSWLLTRLYPRDFSTKAGMRLGTAAGFVFGACSTLGMFSVFRMPLSAIFVWTALGVAESTAAGAAIGWVTSAHRPWQRILYVLGIAAGLAAVGVLAQNVSR